MFYVFGWVLDPAFQSVSGGLLPIDMSPDKSPGTVYNQLMHYTDRSRVIYRWFFLLDFIYPPTLAMVFATLWAWLSRNSRWEFPERWLRKGLLVVPFVAAALDWTENVGFLTLIESYPTEHRGVALFAAGTNYLKLAILAGCMLMTVLFALGARRPRAEPVDRAASDL
jgi:hypothetical protein